MLIEYAQPARPVTGRLCGRHPGAARWKVRVPMIAIADRGVDGVILALRPSQSRMLR